MEEDFVCSMRLLIFSIRFVPSDIVIDLLLSKKKRFIGVKIFFFVSVKTGSKKINKRRTNASDLSKIRKTLFAFATGGSVNL